VDTIEFAERFLYPYKKKGQEIIPRYCPYCHGGEHRDKETFALNIDKKTFNCKRGTCGKSGTFWQLCHDNGVEADKDSNYEIYKPRAKTYTKPNVQTIELSKSALEYAAKRKISPETLRKWKVAEKNDMYVFPYYDENNELVFIKYRPIGRIHNGQKKGSREPGGKPILWGMNMVDITKPLIIVEGEFDAIAVSECGVDNVVSVPSGAQDLSWIELCWDWLDKINKFILFGDNDKPGQEMMKKIIIRLGEDRCYIVHHEYKDANDILYYKGKEAVIKAIESSKSVPKAGIIDVADIEPEDKREGIPTGIRGLDRLLEDTQLGELTIWTGKRGEGKSTILGQVILEALDTGNAVFAYSGELTAPTFQQWINTQAAGSLNLEEYKNKYGDTKTRVKKEANDAIRTWYKGKLFLYDNSIRGKNIDNTSILDLCEYSARKYNCRVFVIDNLMTADFDATGENYYQAQSKFVGDLVHFAKAFNVHVHLVAHPRKTDNTDIKDNDDVAGSGEVTNRADNVICIKRNSDLKEGYDAVLKVMKNRNTGRLGKFPLRFIAKERRFYQLNEDGSYDAKTYGWEKYDTSWLKEVDMPCPWDIES